MKAFKFFQSCNAPWTSATKTIHLNKLPVHFTPGYCHYKFALCCKQYDMEKRKLDSILDSALAWLSWLLEIIGRCIAINCFPVFDFVNFEINLRFLFKLFSYITKKFRFKNPNNLKTKKELSTRNTKDFSCFSCQKNYIVLVVN